MKNLILVLMFLTIGTCVFSQSSKTLVKPFTTEATKVFVNFDCNKTINYWDSKYIKFEITINTNVSSEILNSLVNAGRYELTNSVDNNTIIINMFKIKKTIEIGGNKLIENLDIKIWIPKGGELLNSIDSH